MYVVNFHFPVILIYSTIDFNFPGSTSWNAHNDTYETITIRSSWERRVYPEVSFRLSLVALPKLLSSLSLLIVYLKSVGTKETVWLAYVAPYVHADHNADRFIEQLLRLVEVNPRAISDTFAKVLETYEPTFDYQDKMKTLIREFAGQGLKIEAIYFVDQLRRLPGMQELYLELLPGTAA